MFKPEEDLLIDRNDIFKHDMLNRETEVKHISKIIQSFKKPSVLSVDSDWGTGKSIFVRLLQAQLEKDGLKVAFFNSWKSDYAIDALVPLTNEVISSLDLDDKDRKELIKFATFIFNTTMNGVDISTMSGIPFVSWITKTFFTPLGVDLFNRVKKRKTKEDSFRDKLKSFIERENKTLVIIVDELDRCRPTFAVETLERIKHLFNVEGIVFVLATNLEQLSYSVSVIYGHDFKSFKYLERFIDLSYTLEDPDKSDYWTMLINNNESLRSVEKHGLYLIYCFNLSLRDINRYFYRLSLVIDNKPISSNDGLLALLVLMQYINKPLFNSFCNMNTKAIDEVSKDLHFFPLQYDFQYPPSLIDIYIRDNLLDVCEAYFTTIQAMRIHNISSEFAPHEEIQSEIQELEREAHNSYNFRWESDLFKNESFFILHVRSVKLFSNLNTV